MMPGTKPNVVFMVCIVMIAKLKEIGKRNIQQRALTVSLAWVSNDPVSFPWRMTTLINKYYRVNKETIKSKGIRQIELKTNKFIFSSYKRRAQRIPGTSSLLTNKMLQIYLNIWYVTGIFYYHIPNQLNIKIPFC